MLARSFPRWLSDLRRVLNRPPRPERRRAAVGRLFLETLGPRDLPSTFTWIGGDFLPDYCDLRHPDPNHPDPTSWTNPLNWQPNQVPGQNDTVVFPAPFQIASCPDGHGGTTPVMAPFTGSSDVNAAFRVSALTTAAGWGGDINVNSPLAITDGLSMGSGTFGGNGAMAVAGNSTWSSGTITVGTGGLNHTGTLTLTNGATVFLQGPGTFTNAAQAQVIETGAGSLALGSGATLNNEDGAFFRFRSDGGLTATFGSGTFNNRGTLSKDGGTGTSFIGTNTTTFAIAFNTSGLVNVDAGRIETTEGGVGTGTGGTFTVAAGAVLDLTGISYRGTYTGAGDGQVLINATDTLRLAGDTVFDFPAGLLQWQGDIDLNGHTLTNAADGFLAQSGTSASPASLRDNASGGTLDNQGEIDQTGTGDLVFRDGTTLRNEPGAAYRLLADSGFRPRGGISGSGSFINLAGATLSKEGGALPSLSRIGDGVGFNNNGGTIDVQTGELSLNQGLAGVNTGGIFTVAAGAILDLTGDSDTSLYQGTFTGSGDGTVLINRTSTLRLAGDAVFDFPTGLLQWQGDIDLNGHTLTNAADGFLAQSGSSASRASLSDNASGGTLDNQGEIDQTGTGDLILRDGTTLRNEPGAVYRFLTDSGFVPQGGLRGSGSFINQGTLSKDGSTGGQSAINFDVGFDNPGTVEVHQGTLFVGRAPNQVSGSTLTGGTWAVFDPATLTISFPATLDTNTATVVLDGPNAVFTNIAGLSGNGGSLSILDGRAFTTAGDFSNNGTLFIDGASTFRVTGRLTNFANGTLTGGTWLIAGTLVFPNADIVTDAANLVLDGSGPGQILDPAGNNGLADLAVIDAAGVLTLQNGYVLTTGGSLTNFGYLLLDATSQLNVNGDYTQDAAATLEIQLDGIAGTSGLLNVGGAANLDGTLTLTPVNGYVPATGDAFTVLTFATRNGSDFANPPAGFDESFDDDNGILTVIAQ